jgi:hypothetical protein
LKIEKADVAMMKGKTYKWLSHLDSYVSEGDIFYVYPPFQFYVTGFSTSIVKGTFKFQTWIEKGDP